MAYIKLDDYMHIGLVVNSIEETLEKMKEIFSFEEYRINDFPPKDIDPSSVQLMYHGKRNWFTSRFCFIKMGNTEVELIEPVEGESIWKDFLAEHGEGIHHLKFEVDSINDAIQAFEERGILCTQYGSAVGPNAGKTWAYFDTSRDLGYITEILNRHAGELVE